MGELNSREDGKLFYTIGEVASKIGVKSHILRYWESEFPTLRPRKLPNGRRVYRAADIEMILAIKRLLYEDGYTIAGARRKLAEKRRKNLGESELLKDVREDLYEILRILDGG